MEAAVIGYIPLARAIVRDLRPPGGEIEDAEQEALAALCVAARDFKPELGIPFSAFARIVIRRRLATALDSANSEKHRVLTHAARVATDPDTGEPSPIIDLIPGGHDPAVIAEKRDHLRRVAPTLSELERRALVVSAAGIPYYGSKRIDNALCRAKKKLAA